MGILGMFKKEKDVPGPGSESNASVHGEPIGDRLGLNTPTGLERDMGQQPGGNLPSESAAAVNPAQNLEPVEETPPEQPGAIQQMNQQQPVQGNDINSLSQNVQIISSKVDTIKAVLDNLSHKIEKIEQIAEGEQEPPQQQQRGW
ncbi:hypothetical protein CEE44_04455 [Candidatus Woesearchaeota archaeon B3_Woes]|nr:MAG: hypothetical protein CEE44_04455 [Candidatus Woesearchaeota archaeon B3_Woes]